VLVETAINFSLLFGGERRQFFGLRTIQKLLPKLDALVLAQFEQLSKLCFVHGVHLSGHWQADDKRVLSGPQYYLKAASSAGSA
jgi:hypothetical protein